MEGVVIHFLRLHRRASIVGGVALLILGGGLFYALRSPAPQRVLATATRGTLRQTVEAVGTVTSEEALRLHFPTSGVIAQVSVHEGDTVHAGQKLATLQAGDLAAEVASARASLDAVTADLRGMEEGSRPEDIAIAEAEVANKRAALQAAQENLQASEEKLTILRGETTVNLAGEISTAESTMTQQLTVALTALAVTSDILADNIVHDALTRNDPAEEDLLRKDLQNASGDIDTNLRSIAGLGGEYAKVLQVLGQARIAIAKAGTGVDHLFVALVRAAPTGSFTASKREARKDDLSSERTNIQEALNSIDGSLKSLRDAAAGYGTKIAAEEATIASLKGNILTTETSLRTQEAELALTKAGARKTDLDGMRAKLRQAQADLARAQAAYDKTVLTAPVDGVITKVNVKPGELLATSFQTDPAITMLGTTPYEVEVKIAEVDVPKVAAAQTGSVILDAYPGRQHPLHVREVDAAATDVDGVPKYTVTLDFQNPPPGLKIGMQGDVTIVTAVSENVVHIPGRAILQNVQGHDIVRILEQGVMREQEVTMGLEGEDGEVEILSGLRGGESVVVLIRK